MKKIVSLRRKSGQNTLKNPGKSGQNPSINVNNNHLSLHPIVRQTKAFDS